MHILLKLWTFAHSFLFIWNTAALYILKTLFIFLYLIFRILDFCSTWYFLSILLFCTKIPKQIPENLRDLILDASAKTETEIWTRTVPMFVRYNMYCQIWDLTRGFIFALIHPLLTLNDLYWKMAKPNPTLCCTTLNSFALSIIFIRVLQSLQVYLCFLREKSPPFSQDWSLLQSLTVSLVPPTASPPSAAFCLYFLKRSPFITAALLGDEQLLLALLPVKSVQRLTL